MNGSRCVLAFSVIADILYLPGTLAAFIASASVGYAFFPSINVIDRGHQVASLKYPARFLSSMLCIDKSPFQHSTSRGGWCKRNPGDFRVTGADSGTSTIQVEGGGAIPTVTL